ncbi:hypothetical protein MJO28_016734 [Puccinia striiformis f. sp. tritici]|uniref:Uncharacterized protein n=1 Tax=Puccinia striiformis f. sp. tritici TaxID=168172 RepID=A0ACC0DRJ7_9BASI|nr:hypothetical protein MJO28_016734 [Puccinia striiformis f. sp. tritici]
MVSPSMGNPFKSNTWNDKRRKSRHTDCYAEERQTLDALKQGNYSAPIIVVDQEQARSDNDHSDGLGYEAHEELDSGYQSTVDPNDVLSAWGSIPIISAAREQDHNIDPQILANNQEKAMSNLFTSYLWLREKTNNWTSKSSFHEFCPRFCQCDETARRTVAWIDLVDLTGQERVKFKYCDCMPRCVQVLANGFLPSSPLETSAAFSMRLLACHNYVWHHSNVRLKPFLETQRVFGEERSQFLWNRNMTGPCDPSQCLTETVWLNRDLMGMSLDLVQATPRLTNTQKLAYGTCLACFRPISGTGLYQLSSVLHWLILLLDGNFQQPHYKRAGRQSAPLATPDIFVQPSELDAVKEYIAQQERVHKITKKADKCADSRKAGNDRKIWPESRARVKFGTSVFHAYVHEWPCQVKYNPRYQQGWGLSDRELLERLWSSLSPLVSPLRYATRNNRLAALSHRCKYRNQQSNIKLAAWLRKNLTKRLAQWEDQVRVALEKTDTDNQQKKMTEFLDNEEVLESYRVRMACNVSQGEQDVSVRAEKEPVITTDSGNRLGTRLKEKIMGAINCRKNPVEKAIKLFNERRQNYLQKVDPSRLLLPENQDLTLADFKAMDLTDPLWNNNHFYHAWAPWALDPNVRNGIKSVLFLDWVEEEVELLTQELEQSITWACEYHCLLRSTIAKIDLDAQESIDPNNKPALRRTSAAVTWATNVEILWGKTRSQHTKNTHCWFNEIGPIKQHVSRANVASINDTLEQLMFEEEGGDQEEDEGDDNDKDKEEDEVEEVDDCVDGPGGLIE